MTAAGWGTNVLFVFADHVLDTGRRELRRGAEPVAVEPQVLDLLIYLVQNGDHVVSKDELTIFWTKSESGRTASIAW